MKIMYIDCGMGAAGDMMTGALLELLGEDERSQFTEDFNRLGIPGVTMEVSSSEKCGITGTHVSMMINGEEEGADGHIHSHDGGHAHGHSHDSGHAHEHGNEHVHTHADGTTHSHAHSGMEYIEHIVRDHLDIPDKVKDDIMAVYGIIAEAESKAHGVPVTDIHFHEVGTADAIADITAVCMLMDRIGADRVIASAVNTGSGTVRCAHGILPVPAPATAYILTGVPVYNNNIKSELTTPTGAALLRHFVSEFGNMPVMRTEKTAYGMGTKDFEAANCLRVFLGEEGF